MKDEEFTDLYTIHRMVEQEVVTAFDWFVNFMLGITDREGNLLPGHKKKFVGPSWAVEDENNTLEAAYTTAHEQQYEYAK